MNLFTKQKQTHRLRERIYGCQAVEAGKNGGKGSLGSLVSPFNLSFQTIQSQMEAGVGVGGKSTLSPNLSGDDTLTAGVPGVVSLLQK